uniref:cysteine dioxygenase n=1 Tax=Oryza barthii TaxID=65489 RepID=A0A0D3EQN0_9ORYZ
MESSRGSKAISPLSPIQPAPSFLLPPNPPYATLRSYIPNRPFLTFVPTLIASFPRRFYNLNRWVPFGVCYAMKRAGSKGVLESSSSSSKKTTRRQKKPPTSSLEELELPNSAMNKIQEVHDIARDVFSAATPGFVPSPLAEANLTKLLDTLKLEDFGLDASMPYFRADPQGHPKVTYVHFGDDSLNFSFGVFCLPQSAVIPLHDHLGMTVFSKILHGSMHIKSYDWVKTPNGAHFAKVRTNTIYDDSSKTTVLYPESGGNLHCFTAETACAVLDVMGPPYSSVEGRDCSYYGVCPSPRGVSRRITDELSDWLRKERCTFNMNAVLVKPSHSQCVFVAFGLNQKGEYSLSRPLSARPPQEHVGNLGHGFLIAGGTHARAPHRHVKDGRGRRETSLSIVVLHARRARRPGEEGRWMLAGSMGKVVGLEKLAGFLRPTMPEKGEGRATDGGRGPALSGAGRGPGCSRARSAPPAVPLSRADSTPLSSPSLAPAKAVAPDLAVLTPAPSPCCRPSRPPPPTSIAFPSSCADSFRCSRHTVLLTDSPPGAVQLEPLLDHPAGRRRSGRPVGRSTTST